MSTAPTAAVTIVVVTFNSADVLAGFFEAVPANHPLVVVDNASSDNTAEMVRQLAPWADLIVCPQNEGFGRGANIGLARVTTEFGLLLNPDTRFDAEKMMNALVAAARRYPEAGLLVPLVSEESQEFPIWGRELFCGPKVTGPKQTKFPDGDICCANILGAAWLFPMQAFRAIGGFDESVFLFWEEDDVCMRLRRAGHSVITVADAIIYHNQGHSTAGISDLQYWKAWHGAWSRAYMERKWGRRPGLIRYLLSDAPDILFRWLTRRRDPRHPRYAGSLAGWLAYLAGRSAREVRLGPTHGSDFR